MEDEVSRCQRDEKSNDAAVAHSEKLSGWKGLENMMWRDRTTMAELFNKIPQYIEPMSR